jgi:hypothetical protein
MKFEPLTVLWYNEVMLLVPGAEHQQHEGRDFMVAQAFVANAEHAENTIFNDESGRLWRLRNAIQSGFHFSNIILEGVGLSD